ncbi:F-box/WD repeat-containing protein 9 isoform 2-T2 [Odontesthes bonariensis]|uniref:F-box/WD repeat-containing protein 9 isoform X2 n=1 Tax=Odontesthes bonariensis TaxID=219752 RepID=UPI003F58EF96
MSEVIVDVSGPEEGTGDDQGGPCPDPMKSISSDLSRLDLQGLLPAVNSSSADGSPSPSSEPSALLSLPWEILTNIASHLPAQCVINVLPKVCHTLGTMGEDSTAWQLRARRLIGSSARFPVGPREDFDWPTACLEMEHLITCWRRARRTQKDEEERDQARLPEGELQVAEEQEDGGADQVEGVGMAAQEVAYGADEGMDVAMDGEMQPILDGNQIARLREELVDRLEDGAEAPMEEGRMAFHAEEGQDAAPHHYGDLANPRNVGNEREVEMMQPQSPRSPSPPPALECITLPSDHISQVNSVLLLGGEGAVCATASRDYNVKLWDLQTDSNGALLYTLGKQGDLSTHGGWVWCLASQGPLLASGGFDSTVRLWDLQAGGAERGLIRTEAIVLCLSYQTDVLLAGTFDKRISMYDIRAAEPLIKSMRLHGDAVMCLAADDNYIISGSKDCTVAVYDRRAGKGLKKLRLSSYLLSMSHSGYEVWAGDNRGMLHSFSMQAGTLKLLSQFDVGHTDLVTGTHRSQGSLFTCSSDCTVKVHIPCAPPRTLCTLRHQTGVNGLSVEAGVLALACGDSSVEIWRPRK